MTSPSRKRATAATLPSSKDASARARGDANRDDDIAVALLEWFDANHRKLPFRSKKDAYVTWISEIMLQQTQVKTMLPYFDRWMARFPDLRTLANAAESDVLEAWQGLGYYSRGRNLHRTAQLLVNEGRGVLPDTPEELLKLPGIGRYTAGAIASIAYGHAVPAVDGNVIRVICRVDALRGDPKRDPTAEQVWQRATALVSRADPGRLNQALMELGALVCTPKRAACGHCPLLTSCKGRKLGIVDRLPEVAKSRPPEPRHVVLLYARKGKEVLLGHQPESAPHWARLHVLPYVEVTGETAEERRKAALEAFRDVLPGLRLTKSQLVATHRYPITRFRFHAEVYAAGALERLSPTYRYVSLSKAAQLALPAPHRKLLDRLTAADTK
ncbi:MAG: A/G-specific adenine glycosylase [Polyangiaceae bacterium]